ncbi:hypothetical protein BGLA2_880002 [Burkholderia gladioli]|nr:hypothetical protein BGLA2_880002 [Burkholderia gladioli]
MNLQQDRIAGHCRSLRLEGPMHRYVALASDAVAKQWSFLDFLENALTHERETRQVASSFAANTGAHGGVSRSQDTG